jgi:hypothetical protein
MNNSAGFILSHILAAFLGGCLTYSWFRNTVDRLTTLQNSGRWETPEDFKKRTGSSLPGEAAVYCRWKKEGMMYRKLKELSNSEIAPSPDAWSVHMYSMALSLGNAHGEVMEILCADSNMGYPRHAEAR